MFRRLNCGFSNLAPCAAIILLSASAHAQDRIDQRVTWANFDTSHENQRWSMQHLHELAPTLSVHRGDAPINVLDVEPRELEQIEFERYDGSTSTVRDALKRFDTDAFIVLHGGKIVAEEYFHDAERHTPHFLLSIHKSLVSTVIFGLLGDGTLKETMPIDSLVVELGGTAYAGATVRQALDMLTSVDYTYLPREDRPVPNFEQHKVSLFASTAGKEIAGSQQYILGLQSLPRRHGKAMCYKESDPAVLVWAAERVTGQRFADLVQQRVWSKIGAEYELKAVRDDSGFWTQYVCASAIDLARWGQMLADRGRSGENQVVSQDFIDDIQANASSQLLKTDDFVGSALPEGIGYRSFFYMDKLGDSAIAAMGGYGQLCYVAPQQNVVIVMLSSPIPFSQQLADQPWPKIWQQVQQEEQDRWNLCRSLVAQLARQE